MLLPNTIPKKHTGEGSVRFLKHKIDSVEILGVRIHAPRKTQVFSLVESFIRSKKPHLVWAVNVDVLLKLVGDGEYRDIYEAADLVVGDGMPLGWGCRLFGTPIPGRITGIDFLEEFA